MKTREQREYELLEWLHSQLQEIDYTGKLDNIDFDRMLEAVEFIRERYMVGMYDD